MFTYLYPVPAEKLQGLVGKKVHLVQAKAGIFYTLDKVQGTKVLLSLNGVQDLYNAKDVCYSKEDLPKELKYGV